MSCTVWFSKFLCSFSYLHVISILVSFSSSTQTISCFNSWKVCAWDQWKIFCWSVQLSASALVATTFLHLLPQQCTGSISFLGTANHTGFKFGIITMTDPIWKASWICNLLLYIFCCFTGITNDLQCLQIRTKNAKACCILS